ncbi:DUF1570 domain-containing protein [Rhodopirellula sp. MGV]|uniref:DUF1570 domain-containing protein n=1 Tax=Rhodopirellula sp. MGV TaxID=2023130 RepID=UPI000B96EDB9|nr:DUF1570 domain-containing protein [Rhodopirellula sp. MGV]OYP34066.1 hypothetical protein CGZ80_16480 [Rhodopirellula sp. MGV]PNY38373.1 DUF1570 domain-containing protein [Rhodopirellula baltica]
MVTFKSSEDDLVNGIPKPVRTVKGRILVEAQDGGLMLQSDDGRIWMIQPEQIIKRESNEDAFEPISSDEMADRMREELPPGFAIYQTAHYIIAYNANEAYVKQVGLLFEQLHKGFYAYWRNQRWRLPEPEFPLVALVFADQGDFLKHATVEVGDTANVVIGYYHLSSNRMTTFNVPNLNRNVSTIIHEATHQLAYNCGLQTRFADNPMWVSEGLALFFEAPDYKSASKWRGVGRVNEVNLQRWKLFAPNRPADSLVTLISDDERFRDTDSATDAYAEGWALTYYLLKTHREEYVAYLKELSEGKPMRKKTPRDRVEMFERIFGKPIAELDKEFLLYMRRYLGS